MLEEKPNWKEKVITGDETWVYVYEPETKRQSMEWKGKDEPRTKKSRLCKSKNKDRTGVTLMDCSMAYWQKVITALLIIGCVELNPGRAQKTGHIDKYASLNSGPGTNGRFKATDKLTFRLNRELLLQKVKKLIAEDMQIADDVVIAECHRLGRGPKAPILIEVPDHESRISLLKNSSKLRILKIFMSRDYSLQIREQRKFLIEKRKELYKKGIRSKLRENKLLLNGINYMVVEGQMVNAKGEPI
ncbi:hypothetical protein LAZ67_2005452 [Cordylochernes scorpioides]|uniref:Uncharacterized protein n=1 Tax=Cordylochernes scorpioides TaxID=51811 RepID=A0ABY6K4D5_9ARAC|nr:hypothetical protein LAZ67_2005452 [Cordylochernes scorpioides]